MRRAAVVILLIPILSGCAGWMGAASGTRSVEAVVQDEGARQEAAQAAQSGETSTEALAHVADGPKP